MTTGEWVFIKGCGKSLKFKIIAFTRNKSGRKMAILHTSDSPDFGYRFVPVEQLESISV